MNRKWLVLLMLTFVLLLFAACGGNDDEDANGNNEDATPAEESTVSVDIDEAKSIFDSNCTMCHGAGAEKTTIGEGMSPDHIEDIIHNGKGEMPPVETISDEDAEIVATWLSEKEE